MAAQFTAMNGPWLRSAAGAVEVQVEVTDQMRPGVVSLPHGFGHAVEGVQLGVASKVAGPSANDVTDPKQVDGLTGTAVFNAVPVEVVAV